MCSLLFLFALLAPAGGGRIVLDDQKSASKALQKLIEATGRAGLSVLLENPDKMVALHAAWELAKGDKKKTNEFITRFKDRLKITPPRWWQELLMGVDVRPTHHCFWGVDGSKLRANSRLSNERLDVVTDPRDAGFGYPVEVTDRKTKKVLWKGHVWAAGRIVLLGAGRGNHQIELVVSDGRLFVFGAEDCGAYAEAFNLEDGKPLVRFCTCYWFNFSEKWKLK
jgi:hypothetical protein